MQTLLNGNPHRQRFVTAPSIAKHRLAGVILILLVIACWQNRTMAAPIMLQPAAAVNLGAGPLDLGEHAIPCVADWNGDGLDDLIVGYKSADKVALLLNSGTASQPAFNGFVNLQAGGVDIYHYSTGCGAPAPWVCDYDADGRRDLLVGRGADGQVYYYQNTNTDRQPILAPGVLLMMGSSPLSVFSRATPYIHDWDEDGLKDLICGAGDGKVYWFRNVGTAQSPAYSSRTPLQAGGADVYIGSRSAIRICDWDGDGIKDLVGSASYTVIWCHNIGNNQAPILEAPVRLEAPESGSGLTYIMTWTYRNRLEVTDWNHDGVLDILVGDSDGKITLFEGYHFGISGLTPLPDGQCRLEWNSAEFLHYNVLFSSTLDCVCQEVASGLPATGKTTTWTNSMSASEGLFRI